VVPFLPIWAIMVLAIGALCVITAMIIAAVVVFARYKGRSGVYRR